MAKAHRSPLLGYNHNVRYHGRIFHIQTEDSGPGNPHLYTHLFYEGTILSSKKQVYDGTAREDAVRALMQAQHKAMMKELKQATHDDKIGAFFAGRGETVSLEEPETAAPIEGPGAGHTRALDLDAIPTPPPDLGGGVPQHVPSIGSSGRLTGGGVYAGRGHKRDHPFGPEKTPTPTPIPDGDTIPRELSATGRHPVPAAPMPPVPPREPGSSPRPPPVPPREPGSSPRPPAPAPVVVLQPVRKPQRPPTRSAPSAEGVVVQRQVVVGVGGPMPAAPQRPARPARPVPYVVSSGAHPTHPPTPPAGAARPAVAGRPVVPMPATPTAPLPAAPVAPGQENPFRGDLITDKSLDDVILAYLSEDSGGTPSK